MHKVLLAGTMNCALCVLKTADSDCKWCWNG